MPLPAHSHSADDLVADSDVEHYLRGVAWCMRSYIFGTPPDQHYRYLNEHGAPSPRQCLAWLEAHAAAGGEVVEAPESAEPTLSVDEVLLLLMPHWGRNVLPERLRPAMDDADLSWYYPPPCPTCDELRGVIATLSKEREALASSDKSGAAKMRSALRSANNVYGAHRGEAHMVDEREPLTHIRRWLEGNGNDVGAGGDAAEGKAPGAAVPVGEVEAEVKGEVEAEGEAEAEATAVAECCDDTAPVADVATAADGVGVESRLEEVGGDARREAVRRWLT